MKVVFLSNCMNHHQYFLSRALWEQTSGAYHFWATEPISDEYRALGYRELGGAFLRTLREGENEAELRRDLELADVVILGSVPETWARLRIRTGKLTFRYSERPLKNGPEPMKYLPRWVKWHRNNPYGGNVCLLAASAFAPEDYGKFGLFRDRSFRWGYFPELRRYASAEALTAGKDPRQMLWAGRFLDWKHPDDALAIARRLRDDGVPFHLRLAGTGPMAAALAEQIQKDHLENCVELTGPMPPDQIRDCMERAGIFLFTSDRREGWGAVVNEAMNSGCAVVASDRAGSVPYLLRDGENGLVYASGDREELYRKTKMLLEHPSMQTELGRSAYAAIASDWNAETAAERLLALSDCLLSGGDGLELYGDGPCSAAKEIKENWYR